MNRKQVNVVTRVQSRAEKLREEESQLKMEDCEVIPQNWFNEDESNIKPLALFLHFLDVKMPFHDSSLMKHPLVASVIKLLH
jgi:hypothetical protein